MASTLRLAVSTRGHAPLWRAAARSARARAGLPLDAGPAGAGERRGREAISLAARDDLLAVEALPVERAQPVVQGAEHDELGAVGTDRRVGAAVPSRAAGPGDQARRAER